MTANSLAGQRISLSIASIGIDLHCLGPIRLTALQKLYQDYPGTQPAQLTISINLLGPLSDSNQGPKELSYQDPIITFPTGVYRGKIDLSKREGQVTIYSSHPVEDIDYLLRLLFAVMGFRAGGILFHAAGIVHRGRTHVFLGHSGTGKSTISKASSSDIVLNDDLVLLMPKDQGWVVYSTPFWNISQVQPTAANAPLAALYKLIKDQSPYLESISPSRSFAELISCIPVIASEHEFLPSLMERCSSLLTSIPVYSLHFTPDSAFWDVIDQELRSLDIDD